MSFTASSDAFSALTIGVGRISDGQPRSASSFLRIFCRRSEYLGAIQLLALRSLVGWKGFRGEEKAVGIGLEEEVLESEEGDSRVRKEWRVNEGREDGLTLARGSRNDNVGLIAACS